MSTRKETKIDEKPKIIIIGGIAAGTCAAVKARRASETAEIILYEKYKYVSYATCGLPYFVSGKIADTDSLVVNSVALLEKRFNLKINVLSEVIKILPNEKTIVIRNLRDGSIYKDNYDKLIIATGTKPIVINEELEKVENVFCLRTIDDALKLKSKINIIKDIIAKKSDSGLDFEEKQTPNIVIVGGGYIGLELLDAFLKENFKVTIIEATEQLLPTFDYEIVEYLENYLLSKGVIILKNQKIHSFEKNSEGQVCAIKTTADNLIQTDLVFLGVGAVPNVDLAKDCGIKIGKSGAIVVNEYMQTSIDDIYAAGDCCECEDLVTGINASYLLAGIASLQGRIAGYNAVGGNDSFYNANPTSAIKVLDVFLAKTGVTYKLAKKCGLNPAKIELHALSHGGYYPGAQMIHMVLIYNKEDGTILGFEAIGKEAVDKKADVISVAIRAKLKVWDLVFLNFCYHPETGSAKDSINILGMIGENIKKGEMQYMDVEELKQKLSEVLVLDVRSKREYLANHIPGAINIPIDELRENLFLLEDKIDKEIVVHCRTSYRSYLAYRILKSAGFKKVYNLNGSYLSWDRKL